MKTLPWIMGGALLFWGWENGMLIWGALMAVALEGSRLVRTRWEFSNGDLNRISDMCAAMFLGAAFLLYSTEDRLVFLFKLAQWLPFCCFPLMLAQAYGSREKMPLSVFWWLLRRSPSSATARRSYNISYCYLAVCLLAASSSTMAVAPLTANNRYFYPGVALLIVITLTGVRPRRVPGVVWVALLAVTVVAGRFSYRQLQQMQNAMEGALGTWISSFFHQSVGLRECPTRIGMPGEIPLSEKIVLRIHPDPGGIVPPLLREATWDVYKNETWLASNNDFYPARTGADDSVKLLPTNALCSDLQIARYYENGTGLLDLPQGACEIGDFNIMPTVTSNRLGQVHFDSGPNLLLYNVTFGPNRCIDAPPDTNRDFDIPERERPVISNVVAGLKLDGLLERQKIRAIERYFESNFTYSLYVPRRPERTNLLTPLGFFLLRNHAGHCEYFATATVLMLRQAGIPARYATGFAVLDTSRRGDTYLVRERHGHAWALAYRTNEVGGTWEPVDTTPASWDQAGTPPPSWWESASDRMSDLYFQFSKWRWSKTSYARFASWLIVPLILYLAVRVLFGQRRQRPARDKAGNLSPPWPGLDSELYLINQQLAVAQLSRQPNEPLRSWQERLEKACPDSGRLHRIFQLHRSLRFDPLGLPPREREALREEAHRWLAEFNSRLAEQGKLPKGAGRA